MQPIPVKVKNVSVFAYFNPDMPISEEILTGASGTYSVGTLITSVFYNLDLTKEGKKTNPLNVNGKYYAVGETESGEKFTTPWMFCLDNSNQPKFGRTINLALEKGEVANAVEPSVGASDYITLSPLKDITVSELFPPPAIGQRTLINDGTGNIIATRVGTPHEMGVEVKTGERFGPIIPGMKNVMITGKVLVKEGRKTVEHTFSQTGYTVISGGQPAIFLRKFF